MKNGGEDKVGVEVKQTTPSPGLDGQIWPLPASARRVVRHGKNCEWRQTGGQIQGRWLRFGKGIQAAGGSGVGSRVQRSGNSKGSPGSRKESKRELGGPGDEGCLPSAMLKPGGGLQPLTNHAQRKSVPATEAQSIRHLFR